MRVWAARAVYGLALGGAVLFYCFYFGQLAWYVLMLAVCLPLFSLVVSLPAMLTAGIVLHAPAAVEREKTCVLQVYMLGWMPAARMEVRISVEDRTHPGQDCARWLHLRGEAPAEWELDTAHCAALRCSVRRAWVYDYLGLFRLPVRRPGAVIVTVRPRPVALSPEPPLPGAVSGGPMKPRVGAYAEEHELRPYRPGRPYAHGSLEVDGKNRGDDRPGGAGAPAGRAPFCWWRGGAALTRWTGYWSICAGCPRA